MARLVFNPDGADAEVVVLDAETLTVGSAEDNDVCVDADGVEPYQLRFEQQDGLVTVVDVGENESLVVDGRPVGRFVLGHRALVQVGDLSILFLEEAASVTTALARVGDGVETELTAQQHCPHCGAPRLASEPNCPRCGMIQPRNADAAPLAPTDLYVAPMQSPQARGAGILPMLSFFFGLFGPVVLGIGWLLGIIFGFISLSLIRQRGGFVRDRRYAMWGITLGFLWIAAMGAGGFWYEQYRQERKLKEEAQAVVKLNEDQAAFLLKEIAVVEEYLKSVRAIPLDGGSAYASLEQLRTLPNPFVPNAQFGERAEGYLFTVKAQGADGFTASARPDRYGTTGRMTFAMDQTGILRGGDIGGVAPWHSQTVLRALDMGRSVYLEARERVARELLVEARRLAEEKQFDRSQFILRELQKKYMLTETFKNFEGVARGVEQLIVNARAEADAVKVEAFLKENKKAEALALMKQILAAYPTAANAGDLKAKAGAIEAEFAAIRNQQAEAEWARVASLENSGQVEPAITAFRAFAANFADTAACQNRKQMLQDKIAKLEEKQAATLYSTLIGLNTRSNAVRVVQIIADLQGPYAATPTAKNHAALLQNRGQEARSYVLADEGMALRQQKNFIDAADRIDQALALNPSLATTLARAVEECYLKAGETCLQTNKLIEAAAYFGKFLQLTPNPEKLGPEKLKQLYLALGEVNYLNRNYTNAVSYLKKGAKFFGQQPKYYRMYGQSLLRQRMYVEAMPVYTALIALTPSDPQARFERGLCGLGISQSCQSNVVASLTAGATSVVVAGAENRPGGASTALLGQMVAASAAPLSSSASKAVRAQQSGMQSKQVAMQTKAMELLRDKQFEARVAEALDRVKGYTPQTPEATIVRESVRLVNDIQGIHDELKMLTRDARTDESQNKVDTARNQLLSIFTTQQDYFDKIIAEKLVLKKDLLTDLDQWRAALDGVAADFKTAATLEVYRGPVAEMDDLLQKKLKLFAEANDLLKPALTSETKALEEARELIKLAVSKFKGWPIGWDLNERIQQFFFSGYTDASDKHSAGEKKLREAAAIVIPFEKNIAP